MSEQKKQYLTMEIINERRAQANKSQLMFSGAQKNLLRSPDIDDLLKKVFTEDDLATLTVQQCNAIDYQYIAEVLLKKMISFEEFKSYTNSGIVREKVEAIIALKSIIEKGILSIQQAFSLNVEHLMALKNPKIQDMLSRGVVTLDAFTKFTLTQMQNFTEYYSTTTVQYNKLLGIKDLLELRIIDIKQVLQLNDTQAYNLTRNSKIQNLIIDKTITVNELLTFDSDQMYAFSKYEDIKKLIENNIITKEQLVQLKRFHVDALLNKEMYRLFLSGAVKIEEFMLCAKIQVNMFVQNEAIIELLKAGIFSIRRAMNFSVEEVQLIINNATALKQGKIKLPRLLSKVSRNTPINYRESTHNFAVENSVSEMAKKLSDLYKHNDIDQALSKLYKLMSSLDDNNIVNRAAKKAFASISNSGDSYTEKQSGVTLKQICGLAFLAISDDSKRQGTFKDAFNTLIYGLYEIQRGGNLSDSGKDTNPASEDVPICIKGSFNKFVEKLQGIHPDCEIKYITQETALLKLQQVVQEEAMAYLKSLPPKTLVEKITDVEVEGIEVIYPDIIESVRKRMWEEFQSIYENKSAFDMLIENGQWVNFTKLESLKKSIASKKRSEITQLATKTAEWKVGRDTLDTEEQTKRSMIAAEQEKQHTLIRQNVESGLKEIKKQQDASLKAEQMAARNKLVADAQSGRDSVAVEQERQFNFIRSGFQDNLKRVRQVEQDKLKKKYQIEAIQTQTSPHIEQKSSKFGQNFIEAVNSQNFEQAEQLLIDHTSDIINYTDADGNTPIHYMVKNKIVDAMKKLRNKELLQKVLDYGADVNAQHSTSKVTPLHRAITVKEFGLAELLLENRADLYIKTTQGKTSLELFNEIPETYKQYKGYEELKRKIEQLTKPKPDLTTRSSMFDSPFLYSGLEIPNSTSHLPKVSSTISESSSTDSSIGVTNSSPTLSSPTSNNSSDLHDPWLESELLTYIREGHLKQLTDFLAANKVFKDYKDADGNSLLHLVASSPKCDPNMLHKLLEMGLNVNATNNKGKTPLYIAVLETKRPSVVKTLLDSGADVTLNYDVSLSQKTNIVAQGRKIFGISSPPKTIDKLIPKPAKGPLLEIQGILTIAMARAEAQKKAVQKKAKK